MARFKLPCPSRVAAAVALGVLMACGTSSFVPTPFAHISVVVTLAGAGGAFSLIALPADGSVLTSWSGCIRHCHPG